MSSGVLELDPKMGRDEPRHKEREVTTEVLIFHKDENKGRCHRQIFEIEKLLTELLNDLCLLRKDTGVDSARAELFPVFENTVQTKSFLCCAVRGYLISSRFFSLKSCSPESFSVVISLILSKAASLLS